MSEESDSTSSPAKTSPWPPFVAIGFAISEVGVLLNLRPVSVGGLLLLVGSITGMVTESRFRSRSTLAAGLQGIGLVGIGAALIILNQTGTTIRGQSIVIAGVLVLFGTLLWRGFRRTRTEKPKSTTEPTEATSD